jgi:hypothetical protein
MRHGYDTVSDTCLRICDDARSGSGSGIALVRDTVVTVPAALRHGV